MGNSYFKLKYYRQDKAEEVIRKLRRKLSELRRYFYTKQETESILVNDLIAKEMSGRALLMLRRKKFIANELLNLDAAVNKLEDLVESDFNQVRAEIISRIRSTKETFGRLYTVVMIPNIERMSESTMDGLRKRNDLIKMLVGVLNRYDELDVSDELMDRMEDDFKSWSRNLEDDFYMHEVEDEFDLLGAPFSCS